MSIDRRDFFKWGGLALMAASGGVGIGVAAGCSRPTPPAPPNGKADYTLRIGIGTVELAPDQIVSTLTYNGQFPGPLVRFKEGQRTWVDIFNDTDSPEQLHWHGQQVGVDVDGAAEEGTPYIPAHGMRRISFVPGPAGFRFYHTHVVPRADLSRGQYSGLVGPVYIEPKQNPGAYDQEIFLTLKEFEPRSAAGATWPAISSPAGRTPTSKRKANQRWRPRWPGATPTATRSVTAPSPSTDACSAMAIRSAFRPVSGCCCMSSTAAPPKPAAWRCPGTPSP